MGACVSLGASLPFLLPLLSAHLLWAEYKISLSFSLSQEECQSVGCQSQLRLPFHLSFLPMTEEGAGGGGRTATLPTHTLDTLHFWKQCWSGGKSKSDAFFPSLSDALIVLWLLLFFCSFRPAPKMDFDAWSRPSCLSFQVAHTSVFTPRRCFGFVCLFSFLSPPKDAATFSPDRRGNILSPLL